jgi:hypothetical protein
MNRNNSKEPLYRKVNTKARNVHHNFGGDFKYSRNKKRETLEQTKGTMFGKQERGLDYTPLFRFLLSKVGSEWNQIFSEIKTRIDRTEPIFWIVSLNHNEKKEFVRVGESSYYSGMFVDENGMLQLSNAELKATELEHYCDCCTHTFNGIRY